MQDYKPGAEEWRISYVAGGIAWRELWICRLICKLVILPGGCPGVEGCWVVGLLGCWVAGLPGCWVAGLLGWLAVLSRIFSSLADPFCAYPFLCLMVIQQSKKCRWPATSALRAMIKALTETARAFKVLPI